MTKTMSNKLHLTTKKDKTNGYYYFGKGNKRMQLCGDSRRDGFWIKQLAEELGKEDFMRDFRDILSLAAERNVALFSLYELPQVIHADEELVEKTYEEE